MSKNPGNKSAAPRKSGSPLLTGILVGMIIGVAMAAGLAWFIMKSPSPFVQKEQVVAKPAEAKSKPSNVAPAAPVATQPVAPQSEVAASGVAGDKPRFEFYKVLTDKPDANAAAAKPADKAPTAKPSIQYLQAGSFASADDAEKLKAKLALLGFVAGIQTVTIPDKGVWNRVRLGPYKSADEMNRARTTLKQNGVDSTPIPAQ